MSTKRYEVTYWHTGDDGKKREPGDVVSLDPEGDEVRRRTADAFLREAAPKSEAKAEAKADEKK